jgi:hypothetical protein
VPFLSCDLNIIHPVRVVRLPPGITLWQGLRRVPAEIRVLERMIYRVTGETLEELAGR